MKKRTIQEVANFFGVPMEWTGREVMFRIGEYTLTKSMENFIENPDTNYVVRFEPENPDFYPVENIGFDNTGEDV